MDLTKAAAYSEQTPYDVWQAQEEIAIQRGHCIEDLSVLAVAPWVCDGCQAERAESERPSMVTSKPANEGHLKTGQRRASETGLF